MRAPMSLSAAPRSATGQLSGTARRAVLRAAGMKRRLGRVAMKGESNGKKIGQPLKSKVGRKLKRFKEKKWVENDSGRWKLAEKGKKEAERVKQNAALAGAKGRRTSVRLLFRGSVSASR
jgi:hypothetical protein